MIPMAPNENPDDEANAIEDRRQSVSDWLGLFWLVAALCFGFALLVAAGYGVRALLRAFN